MTNQMRYIGTFGMPDYDISPPTTLEALREMIRRCENKPPQSSVVFVCRPPRLIQLAKPWCPNAVFGESK